MSIYTLGGTLMIGPGRLEVCCWLIVILHRHHAGVLIMLVSGVAMGDGGCAPTEQMCLQVPLTEHFALRKIKSSLDT